MSGRAGSDEGRRAGLLTTNRKVWPVFDTHSEDLEVSRLVPRPSSGFSRWFAMSTPPTNAPHIIHFLHIRLQPSPLTNNSYTHTRYRENKIMRAKEGRLLRYQECTVPGSSFRFPVGAGLRRTVLDYGIRLRRICLGFGCSTYSYSSMLLFVFCFRQHATAQEKRGSGKSTQSFAVGFAVVG